MSASAAALDAPSLVSFPRTVQREEDWLSFALTRARDYRMQQERMERGSPEDLIAESVRQIALTAARMHLRKLCFLGWKPDRIMLERIAAEGLE